MNFTDDPGGGEHPMTDPVACLTCSALVRRSDVDAHQAWHRGNTEAIVRTVTEAVVLALMKGGTN